MHDGKYGLFDKYMKHGFGVIAPSRSGYGRTPRTSGDIYANEADLFAALLDDLNIDKVVLVAVSGGGPTGVNFAARHPERIACLIMECAV